VWRSVEFWPFPLTCFVAFKTLSYNRTSVWCRLKSFNDCNQSNATDVHSHTRSVLRECFNGNEASQWKRPKLDPSPHQNPCTDLAIFTKFYRRDYVLNGTRHAAFGSDRFRGFCSQIRDFAVLFDLTFVLRSLGFFSKATAYILERIFTQNTSKHVVSGTKLPFGGPDNYI